jgi:hypothetical protein
MKTAITVVKTEQQSMDSYADVRTTKVFDDNSTIGEIKDWIISTLKLKKDRQYLGLSGTEISDLIE